MERRVAGFTREVMECVSGAASEIDHRALARAGVSAEVRAQVARAAVQGFTTACEEFHFPLPDEETLDRFIDVQATPAENVVQSALTVEERTRYVEALTDLYAEIGELTSASLCPLHDAWLQRRGAHYA